MGPTGFDSKSESSVSMQGVVGISLNKTINHINGEENYALAA